jgi:hypothetical protein
LPVVGHGRVQGHPREAVMPAAPYVEPDDFVVTYTGEVPNVEDDGGRKTKGGSLPRTECCGVYPRHQVEPGPRGTPDGLGRS